MKMSPKSGFSQPEGNRRKDLSKFSSHLVKNWAKLKPKKIGLSCNIFQINFTNKHRTIFISLAENLNTETVLKNCVKLFPSKYFVTITGEYVSHKNNKRQEVKDGTEGEMKKRVLSVH